MPVRRQRGKAGNPKARRTGKKRSIVWKFFELLPDETGSVKAKAQCTICGYMVSFQYGSTTGMRCHLDRKHAEHLRTALGAPKEEPDADRGFTEDDVHVHDGGIGEPTATESEVLYEMEENEILEDYTFMADNGQVQAPSASFRTSGGIHHYVNVIPAPGYHPGYSSGMDSAAAANRTIITYLAESMQPLKSANESGFRKLLQSQYLTALNNQSQEADLMGPLITALSDLYIEAREELRGDLKDKSVSLSLEFWVKSNSDIYLLASANFISREWSLKSRFIGIKPLPETNLKTSAASLYEKIARAVDAITEEFQISRDKLTVMTVNTFPFKLESPSNFFPRSIPCFNSVLRQGYDVLKECSKQFTEAGEITEACQKVAKEILPSYKELKKHPGKLTESFKNLISSRHINLPLGSLGEVSALANMQEPLNKIVEGLLDEPGIPASTLLPLILLTGSSLDLLEVNQASSNWTTEVTKQMALRVRKYIESSYSIELETGKNMGDATLAICSFLDPRFKSLDFLTNDRQRQVVYDSVMELLQHQENEQPTFESYSFTRSKITSVRSENPEFLAALNEESSLYDPLTPQQQSATAHSSSKLNAMLTKFMGRKEFVAPGSRVMEELKEYMSEPAPVQTTDPYQWWNSSWKRYPTLAEIAKKFLCIRGTSSPTKFVFTTERNKFFADLANIEPEFVEQMLVVRNYLLAEAVNEQVAEVADMPMSSFKQETVSIDE